MHLKNPRESIVELTRLSPLERFPDGRPRVSDDLLERMRLVTTEEAWRVLGTPTGVIFVPPHLAQEVVESSERVRERDEFGQIRMREGRYTPGQIDGAWTLEIEADYEEWRKTRGRPRSGDSARVAKLPE